MASSVALCELDFAKVLQRGFRVHDLLAVHLVEEAVVHRVDRQRHFGDRQRGVLLLLHHLGDAHAALELAAGRLVEVGGELRERRELAVLREGQADTATQALDDVGLRRATDARHRDAGVHGRADAGVEEVGLEEDLAVGDRDDVRRNERGHVTGLRFDDGQTRERTRLALHGALGHLLHVLLVHARGALEQTAVQIEHVAGIRFAARGAAQQQRDLAIGHGLLRQIVIDDERVFTVVHEELAHGAARVRADVLHGGGRRGGGRHDDGVAPWRRALRACAPRWRWSTASGRWRRTRT